MAFEYTPDLQLQCVDAEQALQPNALACISFGAEPLIQSLTAPKELPAQHLFAPYLGPAHTPPLELWLSSKVMHGVSEAGVVCKYDEDILFGVIEYKEEYISASSTIPLQYVSEKAYLKLFEVLDKAGYRHLWRAWNYIVDINGDEAGLERYRHFNHGRQQGFAQAARAVTGNVPAACALGVADVAGKTRSLSLAFLAGRTPTVPIENPRQVSAYHYPTSYGPRSPTFSRASLATLGAQELLFLSGTASIVGHKTVHVGDVVKQTHESITNIEAVLAEANARSQAVRPYTVADIAMRVYVRNANDYAVIKRVMQERIAQPHEAHYLQADICRADLDVEIEGTAWQALKTRTQYDQQ